MIPDRDNVLNGGKGYSVRKVTVPARLLL
jgi:hypothetical protein